MNNLDHLIGNPLFAIETNLEPLKKRIKEGRIEEALEIVNDIQTSIEQAKNVIKELYQHEHRP